MSPGLQSFPPWQLQQHVCVVELSDPRKQCGGPFAPKAAQSGPSRTGIALSASSLLLAFGLQFSTVQSCIQSITTSAVRRRAAPSLSREIHHRDEPTSSVACLHRCLQAVCVVFDVLLPRTQFGKSARSQMLLQWENSIVSNHSLLVSRMLTGPHALIAIDQCRPASSRHGGVRYPGHVCESDMQSGKSSGVHNDASQAVRSGNAQHRG